MTIVWQRLIFTQTTSTCAFSLSSFIKSSLLVIWPPDFSLQPFSFQFFTQLLIPAGNTTHTHFKPSNYSLFQPAPVGDQHNFRLIYFLEMLFVYFQRLTIDGKLAVGVENQFLHVVLCGLFQRFARCLAHAHAHAHGHAQLVYMVKTINIKSYLC